MHIWESSTGLCMGYGTQVIVKVCGSLVYIKQQQKMMALTNTKLVVVTPSPCSFFYETNLEFILTWNKRVADFLY